MAIRFTMAFLFSLLSAVQLSADELIEKAFVLDDGAVYKIEYTVLENEKAISFLKNKSAATRELAKNNPHLKVITSRTVTLTDKGEHEIARFEDTKKEDSYFLGPTMSGYKLVLGGTTKNYCFLLFQLESPAKKDCYVYALHRFAEGKLEPKFHTKSLTMPMERSYGSEVSKVELIHRKENGDAEFMVYPLSKMKPAYKLSVPAPNN